MYTWGYIKNAALAKLDLTEDEATTQNLLSRFSIYANEVMTQVCSSIKPKYDFAVFKILSRDEVLVPKLMPSDFVSFGDDINYAISINMFGERSKVEIYDGLFEYHGYNKVVFKQTGEYYISYNARWLVFDAMLDNNTELNVPDDILDCIPSYIASQCYKIDDEYKASVFRNEYEIMLSRIDNTNYKNTKTFTIKGDW